MPIYTYQCTNCFLKFDAMLSFSQANCKKAYPNKDIAICPHCHEIANRVMFDDVHILVKTNDIHKKLRQLKPVPNKKFEGAPLMPNAGKVVEVFANTKPDKAEVLEIPSGFFNDPDIECDCEFCSESKEVSDGEEFQKYIDKQLAELLKRNKFSLDQDSLKGTYYKTKKHKDEMRRFQKALEKTNE